MLKKDQGWKVAVVGECMLTRPFREHTEPEFLKLKEIMDNADVCYGHLEMTFGKFNDVYPISADLLRSFMMTDPKVAKDLRWLGLDVMSLANNHSLDFGADGVLSTIKSCEEAGIAYAGTGNDLEEAREPGYWEGDAGRVALISTASGNPPTEMANLSKGSMRTRPGLNPLRAKVCYTVPADVAETLKQVGNELQIIQEPGKGGVRNNLEDGEFKFFMPSEISTLGSYAFLSGDDYSVKSVCNPADLEGNLRSVKEAKTMADLVLVAHHYNISDGGQKESPPSFVVDFAHAAIDAGADAYLGHGWHRTLGVEIYKGKPIFYGLGNFFAQSQFIRRVPYDAYEAWGHDINRMPALNPSDEPLHPGMKRSQGIIWWSSALFELEYTPDKQIKAIKFYPVELGIDPTKEGAPVNRFTGPKYAEGRPLLATGESARIILERLQTLSKPYGTEIRIDGEIGIWEAKKV